MKTFSNATRTILCALTLGIGMAAQAALPAPNGGMATIPAGSFVRGDANDFNTSQDAPTNTIYVSAFRMDTNLITYANWRLVYQWATNHGYTFDNAGSGTSANQPAQTVNWYDAVKWCNARSEMETSTPCYYTDASRAVVYRSGDIVLATNCVDWTASGYRLPTEAEWEKAARGGIYGHRFPWGGDTISHSQAWYSTPASPVSYDLGPRNILPTTPTTVGSFAPNGYGLYDMAGNVAEWCWDWYGTNYYKISPTSDPQGPASGTVRVCRGGDWYAYASAARCANRMNHLPNLANTMFGFRCVTIAASQVESQPQIIKFDASGNQTNLIVPTNITLIASSSSGQPVTFAITSSAPASIASISGSNLDVTATGVFTVTASVPGGQYDGTNYSGASTNLTFSANNPVNNTGIVNFGALTNLIGTNQIDLAELNAVLNNYSHTNDGGHVDTRALSSLIGTNVVDQAALNTVLAHYWASSPPYISNVAFPGTNFTFTVTNFSFTVQVNTNLNNAAGWQDVGQARFGFADTNSATEQQLRFYRLVAPTNN